MTPRIYDTDSHAHTFTAQVLTCTEVKSGYDIVLDQTAFFPGGGGQEADRGTLQNMEILALHETNQIVHHIIAQPLQPGTTVTGSLDYSLRFSNMQQHSGEHLISGLLHRAYGVDNVGFHMGSAEVTLDINGVLTPEQLLIIERQANDAVYQNLPISVTYPEPSELRELEYRSKKKLEGSVRIVSISDLDCCACCAPHVQRTGEIGLIKILSSQKYKGGTRISMLCGSRALTAMNVYQQNIQHIGNLLSTKPEGTSAGVQKLKDELTHQHEELIQCQRRMITLLADQTASGSEPCIVFESLSDINCAREYVNLLTERRDGPVALYIARGPEQYQYILGCRTLSIRALGQAMNEALHGRGGGSDSMIQGTVKATRDAIEQFWSTHSASF